MSLSNGLLLKHKSLSNILDEIIEKKDCNNRHNLDEIINISKHNSFKVLNLKEGR